MTSWTNVNDLIATLRKRWATGRYLGDYAGNVPWTPIELSVKAPSASELLDQFDDAMRWAERFQRDSHTGGGAARFAVTYRTVKGKNLGASASPNRKLRTTLRADRNEPRRSHARCNAKTNKSRDAHTRSLGSRPSLERG
jgi:hypothetical protein